MTSAPWWFVLVTALVAGGFSMAASWLAGLLTSKRQQVELVHATTLEREKELYNRRVDFYLELVPIVDEAMDELNEAILQYRDAVERHPVAAYVGANVGANVGELGRSLRRMHLRARVICGKATTGILGSLVRELDRFDEPDWHPGEALSLANHLMWELRIENGVTTRDDREEFEARQIYCSED